MRKVILPLAALVLFVFGCQEETENADILPSDELSVAGGNGNGNAYGLKRNCSSMMVLEEQMKNNPGRALGLEKIEAHTKAYVNGKKPSGVGGGNGGGGGGGETPTPFDGAVSIPVYVHVIYNNSNQNISDAQINSQIAILNDDFNAQNSDTNLVPAEFAGLIANSEISFSLAGVTRKSSTRTSWGTNDAMKSASNGGVDVVDPAGTLNIWVCNIGGGILGYAQFPGGPSSTDGVVISPQYFGSTGFVSAPFNKGRTATHEVGHWLNLRHIWGDGRCRQDDFVADTPSSDRPNYGCPSYPTVHCQGTDMTMNYMDYVDDACMQMFSEGQKDRMRALFATGGAREALVL